MGNVRNNFLLATLLLTLAGCKMDGSQQAPNHSNFIEAGTMSDDRMKIKLLTAILNSSDILMFSKLDFIRSKYSSIYLVLKNGEFEHPIPSITQAGKPLIAVYGFNAVDQTQPYYRVSIDLKNNRAKINVTFIVAGLFAKGHFNYVDNQWIPDKDFAVGRM